MTNESKRWEPATKTAEDLREDRDGSIKWERFVDSDGGGTVEAFRFYAHEMMLPFPAAFHPKMVNGRAVRWDLLEPGRSPRELKDGDWVVRLLAPDTRSWVYTHQNFTARFREVVEAPVDHPDNAGTDSLASVHAGPGSNYAKQAEGAALAMPSIERAMGKRIAEAFPDAKVTEIGDETLVELSPSLDLWAEVARIASGMKREDYDKLSGAEKRRRRAAVKTRALSGARGIPKSAPPADTTPRERLAEWVKRFSNPDEQLADGGDMSVATDAFLDVMGIACELERETKDWRDWALKIDTGYTALHRTYDDQRLRNEIEGGLKADQMIAAGSEKIIGRWRAWAMETLGMDQSKTMTVDDVDNFLMRKLGTMILGDKKPKSKSDPDARARLFRRERDGDLRLFLPRGHAWHSCVIDARSKTMSPWFRFVDESGKREMIGDFLSPVGKCPEGWCEQSVGLAKETHDRLVAELNGREPEKIS